MIAGASALFLEGVANACIPLPRRIYIAACGGFYIQIEMGIMAEVKVRADAEFPPAAAEVGLVNWCAITTNYPTGHLHPSFALEVIEVGRANVYIALLDILAKREAETAYEAVHAVLMDLRSSLRREVCRGDSAVGQFRLRFDPVAFLMETLAVFRGEGEAIRAVVAAAYAAIHVEVILHVCILRNEVDEAAVISEVAAVYRKAGVLIRTAAIDIAAVPIGIGEGTAQDPVIGNLAVIAELVVVVLVLDALRAILRLAARHTSPDALAAFARTHFAETFIHVIVFLTPGHEGKVCHAADRLVMLLNGSLDRRSIDLTISNLGKHFAGDDTILCLHFIGSCFITHFSRGSEVFQCGFAR